MYNSYFLSIAWTYLCFLCCVRRLGHVQSVPINTKVVSSKPVYGEVYSIQDYVITFVSDLRQVGGFLLGLRFPPPIKLITTIQLKYCWKWCFKEPKPKPMLWYCDMEYALHICWVNKCCVIVYYKLTLPVHNNPLLASIKSKIIISRCHLLNLKVILFIRSK